jgi:hypothetical protein
MIRPIHVLDSHICGHLGERLQKLCEGQIVLVSYQLSILSKNKRIAWLILNAFYVINDTLIANVKTLIIYLICINRQNWTKIVVYPLLGGGSLLGRHGDGHRDGPGAAPLQARYLVRY